MLHKLSNAVGFLVFLTLLGVAFVVFIGNYLGDNIESQVLISELSLVNLDTELQYWVQYVIGVFILGINFWIVKRINSKHRFVEEGTIPFAAYYLVFISFFPTLVLQTELLLSSTFCLLMLYIILTIYNQASVMLLVFTASILLGLACILHYPFAVLLIILLMAISIFRSFEIREYLIAIIGVLLPFFYLYSIAYISGSEISVPDLHLFTLEREFISFSVGGGLLFLLGFFSFTHVFISRSKLVVRQRNQVLITLSFIVITSVIAVLSPSHEAIALLVAPLSFCFHIFYQHFSKKWILDLYLLILFATSIVEKINA